MLGLLAAAGWVAGGHAAPPKAATEKVVYAFQGSPDGAGPGELRNVAGTLYGATAGGGGTLCTYNTYGCGTVFSFTPGGTETVLHAFGSTATDAAFPIGTRLEIINGVIHGTTGGGGDSGDGTLYRLALAKAKFRVTYSFSDNVIVSSALAFAGGAFYGTTYRGGANSQGTIFKATADGNVTTVYSFGPAGYGDGNFPAGNLINVGGVLFGTTTNGGAHGSGTFYKFDPTTGTETVLYSFGFEPDAAFPNGDLLYADGMFYGSSSYGGGLCHLTGCGTVFQVTPGGVESVLYFFQGGADGQMPTSGLILFDGDLIGTTVDGGSAGDGTVFKINRATGKKTVLHSFTGGADGVSPLSGLVNVNGTLYGTTAGGGSANCLAGCGTIYTITP
jgi:uncharacterized repeat protein (TIGR03803 family)